MDSLDLSEFFKTKAQSRDFSEKLSLLEDKIFITNFNLESELMNIFGIQKKDAFLKLLSQHAINSQSGSALKEFIATVKEKIESIPFVAITLAFEPTEQTLKLLSDWFLLNTKSQMLIEITVDPRLIGGAVIHYSGKYASFTIEPLFQKILTDSITAQKKSSMQHTTSLMHSNTTNTIKA